MNRLLGTGLLALACAVPTAQASLLTAWQRALENDPEFRVARADHEIAGQELPLARAGLLPQVSAQASYGRADSQIRTLGPLRSRREQLYDTENWALQIRQPLFRYRALKNYRQGQLRTEAAELAFDDSRQQLALRLVENLAQLAAAQAELRYAEVEFTSAGRIFDQSERQLKAGEKTQSDRARAAQRRSQAAITTSQARLSLAAAQAGWQQLTGEPPPAGVLLAADGAAYRLAGDATLDSLVERAVAQNPALQFRLQEREIAREELRKARGDRLPTVDLLLSRGYSESDVESTINESYLTSRVAIQAAVPLFTGGALTATIRQAEARLERSEATLLAAQAQVRTILATELASLELARQQEEGAGSAAEVAQLALRAAELGRAGGTSTLGDRSQAESAAAAAERDRVRARAQALVSWTRIQHAIGGLDEAMLRDLDHSIQAE